MYAHSLQLQLFNVPPLHSFLQEGNHFGACSLPFRYSDTSIFTCAWLFTFVYTCVDMHTYIYIYTHTHIHIQTHTHTHTHLPSSMCMHANVQSAYYGLLQRLSVPLLRSPSAANVAAGQAAGNEAAPSLKVVGRKVQVWLFLYTGGPFGR